VDLERPTRLKETNARRFLSRWTLVLVFDFQGTALRIFASIVRRSGRP
jgi:hypothetical protein